MMSQKSGALAELLQSPDEHVIGSAAAASKQQAQSENFKQRAAERVRRCIVRFMDRLLSKPNLLFMKFHLRVKAMQWNFIKSMNTKYLHKLERRWKMYKDKLREDQFTRLILVSLLLVFIPGFLLP
uniref:Uncharacterized protein n=1 Tax=Chromera velia CCMP2878 TaxID=1169474 RepID=A0A0G4I210_9ALVE|eukprot:Cvel_10212.t1-p1 / transcript=Cvel_10212.t1 / gene=Cvel_10212 / organism=Chromera_velia_CCMP2878 / gene_product=hypothetical protein / transcript_product=hypothetical protein / location=Cvel_scaffold611:37364-37738(+) / protein_length=125 / sequence_SO=supercontig / SO=protein_coding / is_pseudo=false